MKRTQVQLTEGQMRRLRELAAERGVSMAELIREAVDVLVRSAGDIPWEERRRRAIQAVGRFASGHRDISVKHDEYLEAAYQSHHEHLR
ncbi:MAG: CopG family transcriptional regulator [Armatimonadota bacterium]|nr:CopG family transcriptional regulator [Armatimonadota bacterium]